MKPSMMEISLNIKQFLGGTELLVSESLEWTILGHIDIMSGQIYFHGVAVGMISL